MKYVCSICGYVYDDARQKVPFAELPDTWKCPLCGAAKSDFVPQQEAPAPKPVKQEAAAPEIHSDMQKLSAGRRLKALHSRQWI